MKANDNLICRTNDNSCINQYISSSLYY